MVSQGIPTADLHTPEDLLDNAETLFASNNPKMMRAAVLEAITALEAFVHATVFPALEDKFDHLLVEWLEKKTRMDFDSRLSVLVPVAIGRRVDKQSYLWSDYRKAKQIRNKVTHSGRKVLSSEVRFVVDTVYRWLAYLGSTIELELALIRLKRFVEEGNVSIETEYDAISVIREYFGRAKAALTLTEQELKVGNDNRFRGDVALRFGSYRILVEMKFYHRLVKSKTSSWDLRLAHNVFENVVEQVSRAVDSFNLTQGVIIIFIKDKIPLGFETVRQYQDGKVYMVVVQA